MKKILLAIFILVTISQPSEAGGLNRTAAIGSSDVCNGSDPNGLWFPHNLGSKVQLRQQYALEIGAEIMAPKFTYKDWRGRKFESKEVIHALPYLSFSERLSDDLVWGVDISTDYGLGASFGRIAYGLDSETLVSGTYIKPYLSLKLSDRLAIGVGPVAVICMEKWKGPLDINRISLPIGADLQAMGFGVGFQIGGMYWLTDRLAIGINYTSPVTVGLEGDCRINLGPISFKDEVKSEFQFPERLDFSVGCEPAEDWLIVGQVSYWGYSKNSLRREVISFDKLGIEKSVRLNWKDNYAVYAGLSHAFGHWTVGAGVGYMSQAINETADFMTPDLDGYCWAARAEYSSSCFSFNTAISRGWGENHSHGKEITADIWTVSVSGTIKF